MQITDADIWMFYAGCAVVMMVGVKVIAWWEDRGKRKRR